MRSSFQSLVRIAGAFLLSVVFSNLSLAGTCMSPDADLDGDGWGFENGDSCRMPGNEPKIPLPVCSGANADDDGDGFGWENGGSCKVATPTGPTLPVCVSPNADSDGDGFGWENNQSCRMPVVLGDSRANPIVLALGERGTVSLPTLQKWFAVDIVDSSTSYQLQGTLFDPAFYDGDVYLSDDTYAVFHVAYPVGSQSDQLRSSNVCLQPGRYIIAAEIFAYAATTASGFDIALVETDAVCRVPRSTVPVADSLSFATIPGGYVYQQLGQDAVGANVNQLVARSSNGTELWRYGLNANEYYSVEITTGDGVLYFFTDDLLHAVSFDGTPLWTRSTMPGFNLVADTHGVYYLEYLDSTVRALNVDGTDKWIYNVGEFLDRIVLGDDGSVYVSNYGNLVVLDP